MIARVYLSKNGVLNNLMVSTDIALKEWVYLAHVTSQPVKEIFCCDTLNANSIRTIELIGASFVWEWT